MTRRIDRDQLGLLLAQSWALRGTCARRRVGCVLMDAQGHELGTGYNGPAAGETHCTDRACPGAGLATGEGLELCEAIHAEANALLRCRDVRAIHTAYVTHSPCLHCVKLLMNTGCQRIVFAQPYAHDEAAKKLWVKSRGEIIVVGGAYHAWLHLTPRWWPSDEDASDWRDPLRDLVRLRGEYEAIGGGPGFREREAKAWLAAEELFEP